MHSSAGSHSQNRGDRTDSPHPRPVGMEDTTAQTCWFTESTLCVKDREDSPKPTDWSTWEKTYASRIARKEAEHNSIMGFLKTKLHGGRRGKQWERATDKRTLKHPLTTTHRAAQRTFLTAEQEGIEVAAKATDFNVFYPSNTYCPQSYANISQVDLCPQPQTVRLHMLL